MDRRRPQRIDPREVRGRRLVRCRGSTAPGCSWPRAGGMEQLDGLLTPVFWDTTGESRMSAADEGHNRSYVHGLGGIDLQQRPAASDGLGHLVIP